MCQDPEELGANLSTIFCPRCKEGLVMLQNVKIKSPYVKEKNWQCKKCRNLLSGHLIKTCLDLTKMQINQADVSIKVIHMIILIYNLTLQSNYKIYKFFILGIGKFSEKIIVNISSSSFSHGEFKTKIINTL